MSDFQDFLDEKNREQSVSDKYDQRLADDFKKLGVEANPKHTAIYATGAQMGISTTLGFIKRGMKVSGTRDDLEKHLNQIIEKFESSMGEKVK